jgi:hypothetical protein
VARDAEDEDLEDADYGDDEPMVESPSALSDHQRRRSLNIHLTASSKDKGYAVTPASPTDRFIFHEDGLSHERRARIYLPEAVWPLSSRDEALLFRHFVQKLAIWVSLHHQTPVRSMRLTVPEAGLV